jgi:Glycosyl transferases group 1
MRVYQTIHKYNPHIPWFEEKYGISDSSAHNFEDIQRLIIEDGYASSYILLPAIEGKTEEVFFTIWNYERLQFKWADEHGLSTRNLQEIKQAQIAWFNPDVFYDFSGMLDKDFLTEYPIDKKIITAAWFGIIQDKPDTLDLYDVRISLHRPYIADWQKLKLKSFELQPAFDDRWNKFDKKEKDIDILFYGQFLNRMFRDRNDFITMLMKHARDHKKLNIKIHLQLQSSRNVRKRVLGVGIPKWHEKFPSEFVTKNALPPIYGEQLYSTIGRSKFVINGYTNHNTHFKSNMRLFESLGCGSLLISERGKYPDGFVENTHYLPYEIIRPRKIINSLEGIIANYQALKENTQEEIQTIKKQYSKQVQWEQFKQQIASIK